MIKINNFKRVRKHTATVTMEHMLVRRSRTRTEIKVYMNVKVGRYMQIGHENMITVYRDRKKVAESIGCSFNMRDLTDYEIMTNLIDIEGYPVKIVDYDRVEEVIALSEE